MLGNWEMYEVRTVHKKSNGWSTNVLMNIGTECCLPGFWQRMIC